MHVALIGFGSNEGEPASWLEQVVARLESMADLELHRISQLRQTTPVGGPPGQPVYGNAAIRIGTGLSAHALFARLQQIESALGRERRVRWAARTVDLDLLLLGEEILREPTLVVPHPRMMFRRFALEPAVEIGGEQRHPLAGRTLAELWHHLQTSPRRILLVTRDPELEKCWTAAAGSGDWVRELATDLPEPGTLERFRMVIWDGVNRSPEPGEIPIPFLELERGRPLASAQAEIEAAEAALEAFDRDPRR